MKFVFMLLYVLNFSGKIVFVGVMYDSINPKYSILYYCSSMKDSSHSIYFVSLMKQQAIAMIGHVLD